MFSSRYLHDGYLCPRLVFVILEAQAGNLRNVPFIIRRNHPSEREAVLSGLASRGMVVVQVPFAPVWKVDDDAYRDLLEFGNLLLFAEPINLFLPGPLVAVLAPSLTPFIIIL